MLKGVTSKSFSIVCRTVVTFITSILKILLFLLLVSTLFQPKIGKTQFEWFNLKSLQLKFGDLSIISFIEFEIPFHLNNSFEILKSFQPMDFSILVNFSIVFYVYLNYSNFGRDKNCGEWDTFVTLFQLTQKVFSQMRNMIFWVDSNVQVLI